MVHGVLVVEQLLTTGGGWQDQVGGLHPGLNLGTSAASPQVLVLVTVSVSTLCAASVHVAVVTTVLYCTVLYCTVLCRCPW